MSHSRVVIIGAGISGIAAASRLSESGISDITILEAENRTGGRLYTTKFGDTIAEIGGQWCHGETNNVVFDLASKHGLLYGQDDPFKMSSFFESSGEQIKHETWDEIHKIYWEIMTNAEQDLIGYKGSLGQYFTYEYLKKVKALDKKFNVTSDVRDEFLSWIEKMENSIDASDSWFTTSGRGHLEYVDCDGNLLTAWKLPHGYSILSDLLTKKFPNPSEELPVMSKVKLNKEVIKVTWREFPALGQPDVSVECQDGSTFTADHVLVTVSLGVLKERAADLFHPALPQEKLSCIQGLGFGTVDKLFLKFPTAWWTQDPAGFNFLWRPEDLKARAPQDWVPHVLGFHPDSYQPNVLLGWIVGPPAQHLENLTDQEYMDGCMYILDRFVGPKYKSVGGIPRPDGVLRSKWHSNPHFRGSYSCRLMESDQLDVWAAQLAQPLSNTKGKPVVLFAGEATHDRFFSTVHGAVESGWREADRLLSASLSTGRRAERHQVVIVGAGMSGLSAARSLLEAGVTDLVILEAQNQAGGRVQSMRLAGGCLELGAQWVHGEHSQVFQICEEKDLLSEDCSQEGEGLYLREDATIVDPDIVNQVDVFIKDVLENCETFAFCPSNAPIPHSIGEELLRKFEEYLKDSSDTDEVKITKKELFQWHVRFQVIDNSCNDLNELSAKAWGLYRFPGGRDYVNFKNGYSSLVETLVGELPEKCVRLGTPVRRIEWTSQTDTCAKVICDDCLFLADYVVVTSSLGYLKKHYKTMFYPELPKSHSQVIENMGFGAIDKIFLIYDEAWWPPETKGFQLIWSSRPMRALPEEWGRYVTGFDVLIGGQPVLLGWVGGEGAELVERLEEREVGRGATELLRKFTGNSEIPLPRTVLRSRWLLNEFVRGGYSHTTVKCDELSISGTDLSQPVMTPTDGAKPQKPILLFAGEATHESHFSTVHGAFETGAVQAQVILNHLTGPKEE